VFELEADSTIPAEYVLLRHYLGEQMTRRCRPRSPITCAGFRRPWWLATGARRRFRHERQRQVYFALKMIGDSADAPHMARAREAIRSRGGAVHSNVLPGSCWRCSGC